MMMMMSMRVAFVVTAFAIVVFAAAAVAVGSPLRQRHIILNVNCDDAASIEPSLRKLRATFGAYNRTSRANYAASCIFSLLQSPTVNGTLQRIDAALTAANATGVPLLVHVDSINWWDGRPDLWNWWNASLPGYSPANRANVEWTSWSSADAVGVAWRNWGAQLRVLPPPNLGSAAFINATVAAHTAAAALVNRWAQRLEAEGRVYLLVGIKLGWELSIGYNAFVYPKWKELWHADPANDPTTGLNMSLGLSSGVLQIGYASVSSLGIKSSGRLSGYDLGKAVSTHLALLVDTVRQQAPGVQLFSHVGGTYAPYTMHLPFNEAFVDDATVPGYSFYLPQMDPHNKFLEAALLVDPVRVGEPGRGAWAAIEWYLGLGMGPMDEQQWFDAFVYTLLTTPGVCIALDVFNFEPFLATPQGVAALLRFMPYYRSTID